MYSYEVKIVKSLEIQNDIANTSKFILEIGDNIVIKMKDEDFERNGKLTGITTDSIEYKQYDIVNEYYNVRLYYFQIDYIKKLT